MDDKTGKHTPFEDRIPGEVREHLRAARKELRESMKTLMPPEFVEHRRKARREMLLAWRSVIDSALKRMDEKDSESA